jgi:hypothetical protein
MYETTESRTGRARCFPCSVVNANASYLGRVLAKIFTHFHSRDKTRRYLFVSFGEKDANANAVFYGCSDDYYRRRSGM